MLALNRLIFHALDKRVGSYTEKAIFFTNDEIIAETFKYGRQQTSNLVVRKTNKVGEVRQFNIYAEKPLILNKLSEYDLDRVVDMVIRNSDVTAIDTTSRQTVIDKYVSPT